VFSIIYWKEGVEVRLLSGKIMQDLIKFPATTPIKTSKKAGAEMKPKKVVNIAESERFKTTRARSAILEFRLDVNRWPFCVA
jgi:hypothetical protein